MLRRLILVFSFIAACNYFVFSQTYIKYNGCFSDTLSNSEKVFSRIEIIPLFKGNMKRFLIDNISVDIFLHYLQPKDTLFTDTARVKFIMSKKGEISNISVTKAKIALFQAEILRLLRLSSCNWQIGSQGGRYVNGWAQFDVYFRLLRMNGELRISIDYKQHDPPEMPME